LLASLFYAWVKVPGHFVIVTHPLDEVARLFDEMANPLDDVSHPLDKVSHHLDDISQSS
jgi:hypothetical protein